MTASLWTDAPLILASKSRGRANILKAAGIPILAVAANVDERAIERTFTGGPPELARALAKAKAQAVAASHPGRLVLGGDQILALGEEVFHKATTRSDALAQLGRLSGREHRLHSALALAKDPDILFENVSTVTVHIVDSGPRALAAYVDAVGDRILDTVGGYEIEGLGANLIERIDGDFFTVVGLPLLPLLAYCRSVGLIAGWGGTT